MTGCLDHNYPAFNKLAAQLRKQGVTVYNPAENFGGMLDLSRSDYMRVDFGHVLQARTLVVLPGWTTSSGAKLEVAMAGELGLPVWFYFPDSDTYEEMLP